jgi:hypothetical protein
MAKLRCEEHGCRCIGVEWVPAWTGEVDMAGRKRKRWRMCAKCAEKHMHEVLGQFEPPVRWAIKRAFTSSRRDV